MGILTSDLLQSNPEIGRFGFTLDGLPTLFSIPIQSLTELISPNGTCIESYSTIIILQPYTITGIRRREEGYSLTPDWAIPNGPGFMPTITTSADGRQYLR